jgi:hypothetical protein
VQHDSDPDQAVDKFCECITDIEELKKEKKAIKEAEENERKMSDSVRDKPSPSTRHKETNFNSRDIRRQPQRKSCCTGTSAIPSF